MGHSVMSSVYPFLTILGAAGVECSTFTTPGVDPTTVLSLRINDENGFPLFTAHITGIPDDVMRRLVDAAAPVPLRRLELVR